MPEELPEDYVAPPPYYKDLELRVKKRLLRGKGPTHEMNVLMLKEMIASPEAVTKGFVLDLSFYEIPKDEVETEEEEPAPVEEEKKEEGDEPVEGDGEENEGGMNEGERKAQYWWELIRY